MLLSPIRNWGMLVENQISDFQISGEKTGGLDRELGKEY